MLESEADAAALAVLAEVFLLGAMNLISADNVSKSDSVSLRLQGGHDS